MSRPSRSVLAATAHHEAGHAVAAILHGIPFRHVTIAPEGDAAGHVHYLQHLQSDEADEQFAEVHKRGVVAMAGVEAQRRFNPRSVRHYHGQSDRERVADYALEHGGGCPDVATVLARLWELQARNLVARHWKYIEGVATALLERQTLDQESCRRLVLPQCGAEKATRRGP